MYSDTPCDMISSINQIQLLPHKKRIKSLSNGTARDRVMSKLIDVLFSLDHPFLGKGIYLSRHTGNICMIFSICTTLQKHNYNILSSLIKMWHSTTKTYTF